MSYQTPTGYVPTAYPSMDPKLELAIPSALESDPGLHFKGARSSIKYIPASTGSSIGPNASTMFLIPQTAYGFIKPNSMYLRAKIVCAQNNGASSAWAFGSSNRVFPSSVAGFTSTNKESTYAAGPPITVTSPFNIVEAQGSAIGYGGASSIIQRLTVTFPGGVQCSYPQYQTWRNGILPHALSREFFLTDLRQMEHAATPRFNTTADEVNRTAWVCIPLDLPCFNAAQAFPLCLLTGGIQLELQTESFAKAFLAVGTTVTNYSVSDMALIYDELVVSPEFKAALAEKVRISPFSLALNDRLYMGAISALTSSRTNFGVGLSSLKSVVGTIQRDADVGGSGNTKRFSSNELSYWNLYLNGQQMTPSNLDNDAMVFSELQRALQLYNDSNITSALDPLASLDTTTNRNTYCFGQFAFGASVAAYNDRSFALSGVAADQVQVELVLGGATADKWQRSGTTVTGTPDAALAYLWALHDTILTINLDGTVAIRK